MKSWCKSDPNRETIKSCHLLRQCGWKVSSLNHDVSSPHTLPLSLVFCGGVGHNSWKLYSHVNTTSHLFNRQMWVSNHISLSFLWFFGCFECLNLRTWKKTISMISASLYQHSYQLHLPKIWWFLGEKKVIKVCCPGFVKISLRSLYFSLKISTGLSWRLLI